MTAIWTKELTWRYSTNIATASSGTVSQDIRQQIVNLITALLAMPGAPTVINCSVGDGVAPSNLFRWDAFGKIVSANAGTNHSWIVLQFAGGWQLLIDFSNGGAYQAAKFYISPSAAFAGGDAANAAAAADQFMVYNHASWQWFNLGASAACKSDIWLDTGGTSLRWVVFSAGLVKSILVIDTLADTIPTTVPWVNPLAGVCIGNNNATLTNLGAILYTRWNATNYTACLMSSEYGYGQTWVPQLSAGVPNDTCAAYGGSPIGLCSTTAGFRGKQGRFRDFWVGSQAVALGDTYPVAAPDYVQVGDFILPWDGVTAIQTT